MSRKMSCVFECVSKFTMIKGSVEVTCMVSYLSKTDEKRRISTRKNYVRVLLGIEMLNK